MKTFPYRRGFTLIESLVAVAILALSVGGPLWSANRALVVAGNSQNRLTASYLAQEGIEHVRMIRDNGYLSSSDTQTAWDLFVNVFSSPVRLCIAPAGCALDPWAVGGTVTGAISPLLLDSSSPKKYVLGNTTPGTATPFTRTIYIKAVSETDDEKQVVSTVSWWFHNVQYSVSVVNHLTKWQ